MTAELQIHAHTPAAHKVLLRRYSDTLHDLSKTTQLRLFTPSETQLQSVPPTSTDLNISELQKHIRTGWLGHTLVYAPTTPSTQDILRQDVFPLGTVAVTGRQTSGRGRRGTEWSSPPGSVALSVVVSVAKHQPERLRFLQYVAALAVVEAVQQEWDVELRIKWPNDVYLGLDKVGGVLCEALLREEEFRVVIGLGMNVTNERPTRCLKEVVGEGRWMRERFIGRVASKLEEVLGEFDAGFDRIRERYLAAWMHSGMRVKGKVDGIVRGIGKEGGVLVESEHGVVEIEPDEVSLDIREGLIRDKTG